MQFTLVDGGVAVITLISAILAYSRGFTRELFALGGWIVAIVVAYYLAPLLDPLMREAPLVGDFLSESCIISLIAAFTIVVALALLVLSIFTPLVANVVLHSVLGPVDRVLGFVFGVARAIVLIAIAFLIYTNFSSPGSWPALDDAASLVLVQETAAAIEQAVPESVPDWFSDRMETLMASCEGVTPEAETPAETTPTDQTEPDTTEPTDTTEGTTGN